METDACINNLLDIVAANQPTLTPNSSQCKFSKLKRNPAGIIRLNTLILFPVYNLFAAKKKESRDVLGCILTNTLKFGAL